MFLIINLKIGTKICCNVHGVLPYFFVMLPDLEDGVGLDDFIRVFVDKLENSVRQKCNSYIKIIVFDASVVRSW